MLVCLTNQLSFILEPLGRDLLNDISRKCASYADSTVASRTKINWNLSRCVCNRRRVQYRPSRNGKRGSHTAGDVGGGLYSGRSSGGVSSSGSRPHTSQSGTRLPNLTHFPGQANSSNNNAYASSFASTPGLNSRTVRSASASSE